MTWEQKFAAIKALGGNETGLHITRPGEWYLLAQRLRIDEGRARTILKGYGSSPEQAIENAWKTIVELPSDASIALCDENHDTLRRVRWNGFMWEDVPR